MRSELEGLAARHTWTDDPEGFDPMGNSGGNFDDAYFGGVEDGETILAGNLLVRYFGKEA